MSDDDNYKALRSEMREQFAALTASTNKMASAVSDLTALVARIEERNSNHDDGMKRIGREIDDHEVRLRDLEKTGNKQSGGWKAVATIATVASFVVGLAVNAAVGLIK